MSLTTRDLALTLAAAALAFSGAYAQAPASPPVPPPADAAGAPAAQQGRGGGAGGRGGRGGLPGATAEQNQAVADMVAALAPLDAAVTAARNELAVATFADTRNDAAIKAAVEKLRAAEFALASRRADEFAKLQAGPNKLTPEQIAALIASGGAPTGGRGGAGPGRGAPAGRGAAQPENAPAPPGRGN